MRAYGIPRYYELECADVATIQEFGLKSSAGRFPGRSGDYHPYSRSHHRRTTRRYWKRKARAAAQREIRATSIICGEDKKI
jgi:hypothetical protein